MFMTTQQAATAMSTWQVVAVGEPQLVMTEPISPSNSPKKTAPVSQYRDQLMSQLAAKARKKDADPQFLPLQQGEESDDSDQKPRAGSASSGDRSPPCGRASAIAALRSGERLILGGQREAGLRWNTTSRVWERV